MVLLGDAHLNDEMEKWRKELQNGMVPEVWSED
jgi:hypothetical protein